MAPEWLIADPAVPEFYTGERCHITELMNTPLSPETSLAVARVKPGVTTQLHALTDIVERYVVRKGEGLIEVNGQTSQIATGDQAIIGAGVSQRITNTGATDLEFYCLCTPRFTPESYVNLEG